MNKLTWVSRPWSPTWIDGLSGTKVLFTIYVSTQPNSYTLRGFLPEEEGRRAEDVSTTTLDEAKDAAEKAFDAWLEAAGIKAIS